jgi:hypothetical protein
MESFDYDILSEMRRRNASWRLLCSDNAPFVINFLNGAFIVPNYRTRSESDLVERLNDELYTMRETYGDDFLRLKPLDYLKEWSEADKGWLRRFYPNNSDEPHYDLTPAVEKVISWVTSLSEGSFVGTESRLKTIFDLLRDIVEGSEADPEIRVSELKKRRDEIETEIAKIENGDISLLGDTEVRDRFQQFASTARDLLSDFRAVEYNFRTLDRNARERIALWGESKGTLLDEVLGEQDVIADSDQGRSFYAFADFLLSPESQRELDDLLERVMEMRAVNEMTPDRSLRRIHHQWLDASGYVMNVARQLSSQLRRFLDDRVLLENRRIVEIFKKIQEHALEIRNNTPKGNFMELDKSSVDISLMMERPLYSPKRKTALVSSGLQNGDETAGLLDVDALFVQNYVDISRLKDNIEHALRHSAQITLGELLAKFPPERGLAEVLAYMNIAARRGSVFDESESESLVWRNQLGRSVEAKVPRVIFSN